MYSFIHKILLTFIALATIVPDLFAQDAHFSQNYATPQFINPALTGIMPGNVRVAAVYRNQWASAMPGTPFRTVEASADLALDGFKEKDRLSLGLMIYNDKGGAVSIATNYIDVAVAYNLAISQNGYLSAGLQAGVSQRHLDLTNAEFGSQYEDAGFDPNAASNEVIDNINLLRPNVAAGVLFYMAPTPNNNFYAGAGVYHLTSPNLSFQGDEKDKLFSKISFQAGGSKALNSKFDLVPSVYFIKQGAFSQANVGTFFRYIINRERRSHAEKAFNFGPWIRLTNSLNGFSPDALILAAKLDYLNFNVGLSYDVTLSKLGSLNANKGGVELAFIYQIHRPESNKPISCPKF